MNSNNQNNEEIVRKDESIEAENDKENDNNIIDIGLQNYTGSVNLYEMMQRLSGTVQSITRLNSNIYPAIVRFQKLTNTITEVISKIDYSSMIDSFNRLHAVLINAISTIKSPQFTESKKKELIASYEKWGQYGWTINPIAPWFQFNQCPENLKQANSMALKYCNDELKIFNEIRACKRLKRDFEEAVFDFENRKYKSCALVLITLIDASLIRSQKNTRKVGKGAIKKAEERVESIQIVSIYQLLMLTNYISCLKKIYESADKFTPQPDVINRNFLCHGMLWRDVKRMDCLELFLVYYNTLQFLEIIYSF